MILFFDTETTGKANFYRPPEDEVQPRLVQLGAILTDDSGKELSSLCLTIQPEGFEIPMGASSIHGITTRLAIDNGVMLETALSLFKQLLSKAHVICAHNIKFDRFVMYGEFVRAGIEESFTPEITQRCTMEETTDICQIPGPYGNKWPRLQEAYEFAFRKQFDGAHDAMADVRACKEIFFWLQNRKAGVV